MSDVGDLLELLHGAADRWATVQATVRVLDHVEAGRPPVERATRLWIAKPDRWRQEQGGRVSVGRDRLWWASSAELGFTSNEDDPDFGYGDPLHEFGAHIDPAQLLPIISFETTTAADDVVVARVRPRPTRGGTFGLPHRADEHVLTVDRRRGVVVRIESMADGRPLCVSELTDAVWDDEIGDDVFELVPPPGERVRSPRELRRVVTFEEAAQFASFAVFALSELPPGQWRSRVHFTAAGSEHPESVYVTYNRTDTGGMLTLFEQPADVPERRSRVEGPPQVVIERDGTRITISSESLDDDQLGMIADELERV